MSNSVLLSMSSHSGAEILEAEVPKDKGPSYSSHPTSDPSASPSWGQPTLLSNSLKNFYIRNSVEFRLSVKKGLILRDCHKSRSCPQDRCWACSFSDHIPASEPQCHTHSLMGKREPIREFIVLGILTFQVRKKKQKDKKASTFLPENTKLAPALRAWLQDELPICHQL